MALLEQDLIHEAEKDPVLLCESAETLLSLRCGDWCCFAMTRRCGWWIYGGRGL